MNLSEQLDEIMKTTDLNFHDSLLNEMNFKFEEATLELIIEQCRADDKNCSGLYYLSTFTFYKIDNLQITNFYFKEDGFFTDEITSFRLENNNHFKIISTDGGIIEFTAESFNYKEEFVEEVKY